MTEEKKIQLIERLARNASIGKIIVDNHGTMNFNDYMGQEGQQRKEYAVYEEVTEVQPEAAEPPQTMPVLKDAAMTEAVDKCFRFNSDFVMNTVRTVVKEFYSGAYADLALIEVTLFDHGLLKKRNAGTEGCCLTSTLAGEFGLSAPDLNQYLIDIGILTRERKTRELHISRRYASHGFCKTRSHFNYTARGELKETRFPVWTEKGQDFVRNLLNKKRHE